MTFTATWSTSGKPRLERTPPIPTDAGLHDLRSPADQASGVRAVFEHLIARKQSLGLLIARFLHWPTLLTRRQHVTLALAPLGDWNGTKASRANRTATQARADQFSGGGQHLQKAVWIASAQTGSWAIAIMGRSPVE